MVCAHIHTITPMLHTVPEPWKRWMCLWSWDVTWRGGAEPLCSVSIKLPTHHPLPPLTQISCLRPCRSCHSDNIDGQGTIGKERCLRPLSCQTTTSSHLQTTKMCFPQDSIDTVIGLTAAVTMETIQWGAGTVFRLTSERIAGAAMVLAMYARSGADHYCAFWTADSITAVTAGRLQTEKRFRHGR